MTHRQRTLFFSLFADACEACGIFGAQAREAFRHELIVRTLPLSGGSLRNVGKGRDYDKLMAELSRLAQRAEAAAHFATAQGRRMAYLIEAAARQVCELSRPGRVTPGQTPIVYILGLIKQAGWRFALHAQGGEWWLDLTADHEQKLFNMLDTHRRRLLRALPLEKVEEDGSKMRIAFDADATYRFLGGRLVRVLGTTEPAVLHVRSEPLPTPPGGAKTKTPQWRKPRAGAHAPKLSAAQ